MREAAVPVIDATGLVADYVAKLDLAMVPDGVRAQARLVFADTLGVMLASSSGLAVCRAAAAFSPVDGSGCTVVGRGRGLPPDHAALINGISAHDIELDDFHASSRTHPACVVIPAAMAAAESADATGARLMLGIIAGYDVETRVSKAMGVQPVIDRGFHLSGVAGSIGAAVAAGTVISLNSEELRAAIALAAAQSSGLLTFEEDPTHMLKSFNTGAAARSGVNAVQLADQGFSGAPDVLGGQHNILRAYGVGEPDPAELVDSLGQRFELMGTSLKRHACCSQTHAPIDTLLGLQVRHRFTWSDIADIEVELAHDALSMIDGNPLWTHNLQYVLAVAAREGTIKRHHFEKRWTGDAGLANLSKRVRLRGSDLLQADFPAHQGARVAVTMDDGSVHIGTRTCPMGAPFDPLAADEIRMKFAELAGTVLTREQSDRLWHLVESLDDLANLDELFSLAGGAGSWAA